MKDTSATIDKRAFRRFLIIWSGELLSSLGTGLTAFALTVYAFEQTGQAGSSARILLASFLPSFLLRPVGGVLADRMDRRVLMIIGNTGSAAGISLILIMLSLDQGKPGVLYPGIILCSSFSAFLNPAYKASVSDLVPSRLYSRVSGLIQLAGAAPLLLSPLIAGVLMAFLDIRYILTADVMTFLISALVIQTIRPFIPGKSNPSGYPKLNFRKEISAGWQSVRGNPGVLRLTVIVGCILFYISLLQSLLTPMVLSFTTVGVLGSVQSICACGILAGSVIISLPGESQPRVTVLALSMGLMGLFFSFIGMRDSVWMVLIPGFLFFITLPFVNTGIEVLIRQNICNELQGRAWALISFITYSGAILAFALAGFLSDRIFIPLFMPGGALTAPLGEIFGIGKGRGIAFLFFLSGLSVLFLSTLIYRSRSIRRLEESEQ